MAKVTRSRLKSYFNTGDQPTEGQFADIFDSTLNLSGSNAITGSVIISGSTIDNADGSAISLHVFGNIIAENYVVSSSITEITTQTLSGSTEFGNTADDTHKFIGNITASNNISASGNISANQLKLDNFLHWGTTTGDNGYIYDDGTNLQLGYNDTDVISVHDTGTRVTITGDLKTTSHITASGDISASGILTAEGLLISDDATITDNLKVDGDIDLEGSIDVNGTTNLDVVDIDGAVDMASTLTVGSNITASNNISASGTIVANSFTGIFNGAFSGSVQVDHDSTTNFVANEHIDHSGVSITAGAGLTGGGTIAATRDIAVGQGTGVTVNANDIAIGQDVATDANVTFNHITSSGNISAVNVTFNHITSSGNISASGTIFASKFESAGASNEVISFNDNLNITGAITASGGISASGELSATTVSDVLAAAVVAQIDNDEIPIAKLSQDAVTVTAGTNLSNGGTVTLGGSITLNVDDAFIKNDADDATTGKLTTVGLNSTSHITASGNISASGTITASAFFGDLTGEADTVATIAGLAPNTATTQATQGAITSLGTLTGLNVNSHITASGNISASGTITAGAITASGNISADSLTANTASLGKIDGITSLTAGGDLDIGSHGFRAETFQSDIATGTAPFTVASTTTVTNLEAATVATIAGLAPNTATTQATQGNITSLGTLISVSSSGVLTGASLSLPNITSAAATDAVFYTVNGKRVEVRSQTQTGIAVDTGWTLELRNTSIESNSLIAANVIGGEGGILTGSIVTVNIIAANTASLNFFNTGLAIADNAAFTASLAIF